MRALELRRSMDDSRGAAIESYSMGTLFDYQGRFGAAINSKQDALKTFRDLKDRTFWMAEILGGYAEALTLAGRGRGIAGLPGRSTQSLSRTEERRLGGANLGLPRRRYLLPRRLEVGPLLLSELRCRRRRAARNQTRC